MQSTKPGKLSFSMCSKRQRRRWITLWLRQVSSRALTAYVTDPHSRSSAVRNFFLATDRMVEKPETYCEETLRHHLNAIEQERVHRLAHSPL